MTSNHVPLILAIKMTSRMTFRMTFRMTLGMTLRMEGDGGRGTDLAISTSGLGDSLDWKSFENALT